jgi:hypothetical protein
MVALPYPMNADKNTSFQTLSAPVSDQTWTGNKHLKLNTGGKSNPTVATRFANTILSNHKFPSVILFFSNQLDTW